MFDFLDNDQGAMVLACARQLEAAGVDFVLIAGKDRKAVVMSNVCAACAIDLLSEAVAGARNAADGDEAAVNMGATLQ